MNKVNKPDHISESLETKFLGLNYLSSLMRILDPGWKKIRIQDPEGKNLDPG